MLEQQAFQCWSSRRFLKVDPETPGRCNRHQRPLRQAEIKL